MSAQRAADASRTTNETRVRATINLDGEGVSRIDTGLGFLDHLIDCLAKHSTIDIELECAGDLQVDDHHTVEDIALVLGEAIDKALGDRAGIQRFGWAYAPLDESLARVVVDLSGRPSAEVSIPFTRERIGAVATENITHFFQSLAVASRSTFHVDVIRGDNNHHMAEAACKALALALRSATSVGEGSPGIPSTKGVL